jgi:hypothetical protein
MNALGVSLIVGGMALLFSGLIFLLPIEGKVAGKRRSFEENQKEIEYYLGQMRRGGRRLSRNDQVE